MYSDKLIGAREISLIMSEKTISQMLFEVQNKKRLREIRRGLRRLERRYFWSRVKQIFGRAKK
jgi:predicted DNA-binding transcriptional regulator